MKKIINLVFLIVVLAGFVAFADTTVPPRVVMETSKGTIVLELNPVKAPGTVENFLTYVKAGFYDQTIFHRVIDGFMIQGGGMTVDMKRKPTRSPIANEADNGLQNLGAPLPWPEHRSLTVPRPSFSSIRWTTLSSITDRRQQLAGDMLFLAG